MRAAQEAGADDLVRLARDSVLGGAARQVLWLRLATLPSAWRKPHHLRLARAALKPLLLADRARAFMLPDGDPVLVWRGDEAARVQACRAAVAHLFADAELPEPDGLLRELELPREAALLTQVVAQASRGHQPTPAARAALPPLDPDRLEQLEVRLARADVARFARRRDICAIAGGRFARRWEQRLLSLDELAATLAPDCDLRADPWLLRRLTRTLDQRMLALLASNGELGGAGPFAIELNVASILAPEFLRFDAALPGALRGKVLLALASADVLVDPTGFRFAREFTRGRGYRMLLHGVTADLLDVLAGDSMPADLLQVRWSPALAVRPWPPLDPARVVLADVDGTEAVTWGRGHGISLFQGEAIVRGRPAPLAEPVSQWIGWAAASSRNLALGGVATAA